MFITYPTNVDYLITDIRLRIGDLENRRYSDSIIRSALLAGIKSLQRRWQSRYIVFNNSMVISILPTDFIYQADYDVLVASGLPTSQYTTIIPLGYLYGVLPQGYGFIPSGLQNNDVLRNPYHTFPDTESSIVISQSDEIPVIIAGSIILRQSQLSSSADSFQSWTDGEFSFSNIASSRVMSDMYNADVAALDAYFKQRLTSPIRRNFSPLII